MQYRLLHNISNPFTPYQPTHLMWADLTPYEVSTLTTHTHTHILDSIFTIHNRDDRPDGQRAPSLSVGDVVALLPPNSPTLYFSVDPTGFSPITPVDFFSQVTNNGILSPVETNWADTLT